MSNQTITGKVTDSSGEPMIDVLIYKSGTSPNGGTASDLEGKYSIQAKPEDTLIFIYSGYTYNEKHVGSKTVINVEMYEEPDISD